MKLLLLLAAVDPTVQSAAVIAIIAVVALILVSLVVLVLKLSPERRNQLASVASLAVPSLEKLAKTTENPFDDAVVEGLKQAAKLLEESGAKPMTPTEQLLVKAHIANELRAQAEAAAPSPQ